MNNIPGLIAVLVFAYWLTLGDFDYEWVDPLDWLSDRKYHAAKIDPGIALVRP